MIVDHAADDLVYINGSGTFTNLAQIFGEYTRRQAILCRIGSLYYTINISEKDTMYKRLE